MARETENAEIEKREYGEEEKKYTNYNSDNNDVGFALLATAILQKDREIRNDDVTKR